MTPTRQRFKSADSIALQIEDRLVMQFQFIAVEGFRRSISICGAHGLLVHIFLVELKAAPACGFDGVERKSAAIRMSSAQSPSAGPTAIPTLTLERIV